MSKIDSSASLINSSDKIVFIEALENHKNTITKRFDINVGFACNLRCKFCYYLRDIESSNTNDLSTEEVKRRLSVGRRWGKTAVDLTGGEPTIRADLRELISFSKEVGYENICIITNGFMIGSRKGYLDSLCEAGLNDILISLHGASEEIHEMLTRRRGSYARLLRAAEESANAENLRLRFNYVVCQENFDEVEAAADLMASFRPHAMNFILFQPTRDAAQANAEIKFRNYSQALAPVMRAIDKHKEKVPHINVRDIPYCLMKGYESHVKPLYQLQYEKVEWDYCLDVLFKRKRWFYIAALAFGAFLNLGNPYFLTCNLDNKKHMALQRARIYSMRRKGSQCKRCSIRYICDGLVREYISFYGGEELIPYTGKLITNPTYFMPRDEIE